MGVNDVVIHLVETRLRNLVNRLLDEHLQGLLVADRVSPDTSRLAHEVTVRNQACSGVVVRVSVDDGANVATEVEGAILGRNRVGMNDKATNCITPSVELRHVVEEELDGRRADSETSNAWMVLLHHVVECLLTPAATAKVGVDKLKEQD